MKIIEAEAIPIRIALKQPFTIAVGTITHTNHVLVRLRDDEGRVGWGESITFHPVYGYDQKALYHVLTDHLIPAITGFDPHDVVKLHDCMDQAIPGNLMAKTGIDIAVYDLVAQAAGVPLHAFIGGRRMNRIPQIGVVDMAPPDEAAESAGKQVAQGFKTIKIKIGKDPLEDFERVKAVKAAVGEAVMLRVDGNAGYDRTSALHAFRLMENIGLQWIEQPLPAWDLEGLAMLAERLDTPIAVDESMYTAQDARRCITAGAAQVVNIKIAKCGGLHRAQKIAAVCEALAIPCFLGGCIETSVGTAAALHFYTATSNVNSAAEIHGAPFYVDDVVTQPFEILDGSIEVPETPGLGVEVDEDKVEKYRIYF